mgnify:CR=1 FL=1
MIVLSTERLDLRHLEACDATFMLELLNDPNLPLGGPGRSIWGTLALSEFRLEAGPADGSAAMTEVVPA